MIVNIIKAVVMGGLFVVFLPFVGFVMVFVTLAEKCRGLLKESPPLEDE